MTGASLQVQPFASLVGAVGPATPRLLINRERVGEDPFGRGFDFGGAFGDPTDFFAQGDCDDAVAAIVALAGWGEEWKALCNELGIDAVEPASKNDDEPSVR